jgi:hypothetical protein
MLNYDLHGGCNPDGRQPFAISRVAVEQIQKSECRQIQKGECQDGCTMESRPWHSRPSLEGWIAVCVHQACELRSSKPSSGPKDK